MQYSYLPSWITILVDPRRSRDSPRGAVRRDLRPLEDAAQRRPAEALPARPESRIARLGGQRRPVHRVRRSDPGRRVERPAVSQHRVGPSRRAYRNPDSPMWLPTFRDGSMLRFTGREELADRGRQPLGTDAVRLHPARQRPDDLLLAGPALPQAPSGSSASAAPMCRPICGGIRSSRSCKPASTCRWPPAVPTGYGHNFAPASYIDAWIEVTDPLDWSKDDTARLKKLFTLPKLSGDVLLKSGAMAQNSPGGRAGSSRQLMR